MALVLSPTLVDIFPVTTAVSSTNHLTIGGCDLVDLAREHGTPLYLFDEETLRGMCRAFLREFGSRYPEVAVCYASKAYVNRPLARLLIEEGLGFDVVSGGELAIVTAAGAPLDRVYFHGNNKTPDELRQALQLGIGRIVVDNLYELDLLDTLAGQLGRRATILLRLSPGVDPHTHQHTTTGIIDSKFGLTIATGQAEEAVRRAIRAINLSLVGLHSHLGSPIFELEPYQQGLEVVLSFAADMRRRHGLELRELSPGGGFAVQYVADTPAPPVSDYAEAIVSVLEALLAAHHLPRPRLVLEPGRSIVGRAGVAVYRVGARKEIPGVRTYVSVDGGMGDNIRPAIYGSRYEAVVANRVHEPVSQTITLAGKYCESGDVLIRDVALPPLQAGDLIAIPTSGAYCLAMASNYNAALHPPIVLVRGGTSRVIRRRQTYDDLMACDVD